MSVDSGFEQARRLFLEAGAIEPAQRGEYLRRACRDDEQLVQHVLTLLDMESRGEGLEIASASADRLPHSWNWIASELATGDDVIEAMPVSVGPYRIVRELGRGGMGVVYEAEKSDLARRVGLKIMHPGYVSRDAARRFRQEVHVLAQLQHPGIAQVFEAGSHDGRPYFTMELVRGLPLLAFADVHRLGDRERLELLARVCDAVTHAHQRGVVHRDLKPSNILVMTPEPFAASTTAVSPQPKVVDFGVARLCEQDLSASLRTEVGLIIGTVPYMSPEQASGSTAIDTRVDVYALGVIAFELLAGQLPFDTEGKSVVAACRMIQEQEPQRLSRHRPRLAGDVETIVGHAMAKLADRRYQSVGDMAADIRRYLAGDPIAAHPPSRVYVVRKFVARNRSLMLAVSVSLLLLVLGTIVSIAMAVRASHAEAVARRDSYRLALAASSLAMDNDQIRSARRWLDETDPKLRGWEYGYLMARVEQSRWRSHPAVEAPFFLARDIDGELLGVPRRVGGSVVRLTTDGRAKSGSLDARLWMWYNARSNGGKDWIANFDGIVHVPDAESNVRDIVIAPTDLGGWAGIKVKLPRLSDDGKVMALLALDGPRGRLIVVNVPAGTYRQASLPESSVERNIDISPDGTLIAVSDTRLDVFESATLRLKQSIESPGTWSVRVQITDDNSMAALACFDGTLAVWSLSEPTPRLISRSKTNLDSPLGLSFSPDRKRLSAGSNDGIVRVWDVATLDPPMELRGATEAILSVLFLSNETVLSTSEDGTIRYWQLPQIEGNPIVLSAHDAATQTCALARRRGLLASNGWDNSVRLWDLRTHKQVRRLPAGAPVFLSAFSEDEKRLVFIDAAGRITVCDVDTGTELSSFDSDAKLIRAPGLHRDGRRVLLDWPESGEVEFWNMATERVEHASPAELRDVSSSAMSADGSLFLRRKKVPDANSETASIVRVSDGSTVIDLGEVPNPVIDRAAFSSDGRLVAGVIAGDRVGVYDTESGRRLAVLDGHNRKVLGIAFAPDSSRLFTSDYSRTIHVWETATYAELLQLRGHTASARGLLMTPDADLISASGDGTIRVWRNPSTMSECVGQSSIRAW